MTQKEKLETLTGETFPEPTKQQYTKYQLTGTPFWIIQNKEGWNLIMGKYRINNEPHEDENHLKDWMIENHWNIQLSITIAIVTDMLNNQNKQ